MDVLIIMYRVVIAGSGSTFNSYMSFEDGLFQWKDVDGKVYKEYRLED